MLQDLDQVQIDAFIQKWHGLAYEDTGLGKKKQQLLQRAVGDSAAIRQLAGNPLLLTMMAVLNRTQDLPRDRAELYEQCTRLLLHRWKIDVALSDAPLLTDKLDFKDKRGLMLKVARAMHSAEQGLAGNIIDEDRLEATLTEGLNEIQVAVPARAARSLIEVLRDRNFMLCFVGAGKYAFVHRTFLEYFCAFEIRDRFEKERSLSKEELTSVIYAHWQDVSWHEVLCLLAGMISGKFVEEILIWLIAQPDASNTHYNLVLALRCLTELRNRGIRHETEQLIRIHAENLSVYQLPFEASFWSAEAVALETVQRNVLKLIAAAWPDAETTKRWLKYVASAGGYWTVRMAAIELLVDGWRHDTDLYRWLLAEARSGLRTAQHAIMAVLKGWPDREDIVPIIETILNTASDESTKGAAVAALARLRPDDPATYHRLTGYAQGGSEYYLSFIALRELASRYTGDPRTKALARARALSETARVTHQSVQVLLEFWKDDADTVPSIFDMIDRQLSPASREVALVLLFERCRDHPMVIARAGATVRDAQYAQAREAALLLLVSELRHDPAVRDLLWNFSQPETVMPLRHIAMRSLAHWPDPAGVLARLIDIAEMDKSASTRSLALELLAERWGNHRAVKALVQNSAAPGKLVSVRKSAIALYAAIDLPQAQACGFLKTVAMTDANVHVRAVALHTLATMLPDDAEIDALLELFTRSKIPKTLRLEALRILVLERPFHPNAIPMLIRVATNDKSPELRLPAMSELGRRCRENQAIVAVLKQVAARDPNRFIRSSALQELAQLWPVEDAVRRILQHASSEDASNETRKIATDALTFLRERELVENLSHDR